MELAAERGRHRFHFEATLTLGTLIHVSVMVVLLIVAWVHISDRIQAIEEWRAQQQVVFQRELDLIQSMQVNQAAQTVTLAELQRRMGNVESIEGLDGHKVK